LRGKGPEATYGGCECDWQGLARHRCGTRGKQNESRAVRLQPKSLTGAEIAERVEAILETRELTLYQASQKSAAIYGHASPYFLPHNLYYDLKLGTFSPSLYHLFALSRISDYRMSDWLHVFGFDLEEIPRLQVLLPTTRTILLDSSLSDPEGWVPWFRNRSHDTQIPPLAPLSQLLEVGPPIRRRSLLEMSQQPFLYAKIGLQDALAFPDLLPGSIVRVNPRLGVSFSEENRIASDKILLLEHAKGLCCCRLLATGKNRVLPVSTHLGYAQVELQLRREARVLGAVDLEIRPMVRVEQPEVPADLAKRWKPASLSRGAANLGRLLRAARVKAALSLREASALSRRIATLLDDQRCFMSPSSLSDYETRDTPPRQLQKVIALCLVYAVPFRTFLDAVGVPIEKAGKESIPDRFVPRVPPAGFHDAGFDQHERENKGILGELLRRCQEIPLFLRGSVATVSGLAAPSLRSFFWVGGLENPLHPYLADALLVSVDQHKKLPVDSRARPPWQQSLYIVLKRDGTYLCGPCGMENGMLVIHPDAEHLNLREQFRNHLDAEVVGQIVTIVRTVS